MTLENRPIQGGHLYPVVVANKDSSPIPVEATITSDDIWTPALYADEVADDSDKSVTVTAGQVWEILWIWVELTTSADAGNRQLVIQIQDNAADVIAEVRTGIVQAASITRNYLFAPAISDMTAFRDTDYLTTPLPPTFILPEAFVIRVYDNNAIAAAADDMVIQMGYAYKA